MEYDACSTWVKGADKGPEAILQASENMELFDIDTQSNVYRSGIHTGEPIRGIGSPEKLAHIVEHRINSYLTDGKFPVLIGGNHATSIGAFRSFSNHYKELTILQLDAHADLRDEYLGSKYNHACVMARASEIAPIVQAGIRSMSAEEHDRLDKERVFYTSYLK